jgi:transposase-like protein
MKCKNCGYQFVPTLQKEFDEQTKLTVCLLYINGLFLRTIAAK